VVDGKTGITTASDADAINPRRSRPSPVKRRKMDKAMMHILIYVILSAAYLLLSGAPLRVHVLSLGILFLVIPVSTCICSRINSTWKRAVLSFVFATICFLIWDATAHLVIVKARFLEIIKSRPWVYPVIGVVVGTFVYVVSYLRSGLNQGDAPDQKAVR